MNLRTRYISTLIIVAGLSLAILTVTSVDRLGKVVQSETQQQMADTLSLYQTSLDRTITSAISNISLLSNNHLVDQYLELEGSERYSLLYGVISKSIAQMQALYPEYAEISLILPDGLEDVRVAPGLKNRNELDQSALLKKALYDPRRTALDFVFHEDASQYKLVLYRAVVFKNRLSGGHAQSNRVKGAYKVAVNLDWLFELMRFPPFSKRTLVFVADQGAETIITTQLVRGQLSTVLPALADNDTTNVTISNEDFVHVSRPFMGRWNLHMLVPVRDVQLSFEKVTFDIINSLVLMFIVVGVVLYLFFGRMIIRPVLNLAGQIAAVLDSDADDIKFRPRSDEIGTLEKAFVKMRLRLRSYTTQLKSRAETDSLTGLPNRSAMIGYLRTVLVQSAREEKKAALLFIDLDGFKQVNDVLGHEAGDQLLVQVGERMKMLMDEQARRGLLAPMVARLGGDEFTVVLPYLEIESEAGKLAESIIDRLRSGFLLSSRESFVGASIGISVFPDDSDRLGDLIKYADIAMYEAKAAGKMRFAFFRQSMADIQRSRLEMENVISHAVEHDEFQVWFQPKIALQTQQVYGFEALARLNSSKVGFVSPVDFIPVAEEKGLIDYITLLACEKACNLINELRTEDFIPCISINISPQQISDSRLFRDLQQMVSKARVPYQCIEYEVTETSLIQNEEKSRRQLQIQRSLGFSTALDDFGVGYSSLGHLKRFPFNTLKIDRIFVDDVHHDDVSKVILQAIINMAKGLNMTVVAEGVETTEQLQTMFELNVQQVQGFIFSRPLPFEDACDYYRTFVYHGGTSSGSRPPESS